MKFLILEDDYERINWFANNIYPHRIFFCDTAEEAIKILSSENFDIIMLDHDLCDKHYSYVGVPLDYNFEKFCEENLDATTGMAVAKFLAWNPHRSPNARIVIHTMNRVAQKRMARELQTRNPVVCGFDDCFKKQWVKSIGYSSY